MLFDSIHNPRLLRGIGVSAGISQGQALCYENEPIVIEKEMAADRTEELGKL